MPFNYVLVPCDANEPMKELEYAEDIVDLQEDSFRKHIEDYFCALGQSLDRNMLMDQLSSRAGIDLKAKTSSGEMSSEALERLINCTSVEIFPVMLPTKETQFLSVSVYLDDKGVAKNLDENTRMSGIIQACGYPGQTFRGDCFLGRVFDDTEDEWRRCSMTLKECNTDAEWIAVVKKQRSKRSSSDMTSMASKFGMNNAAHINPSTMGEDQAPKGETDQFHWKQVEDEVELTFKASGLMKGDKKLVKVKFQKQHLFVEVKGEVLLDADLHGPTHPDESTWTLSDGVLQVMVAKANDEKWPQVTKD